MAGRKWTAEDRADIAYRLRIGFSQKEIAERYGVTRLAIQSLVKRHKLIDKAAVDEIRAVRMRGVSRPASHRAACSRTQKRMWQDPAVRAKRIEKIRHRAATEEARRHFEIIQAAANRARRGFDLPDEKTAAEYRFLTQTKRLKAREAGAILGLIPSQAIGGR